MKFHEHGAGQTCFCNVLLCAAARNGRLTYPWQQGVRLTCGVVPAQALSARFGSLEPLTQARVLLAGCFMRPDRLDACREGLRGFAHAARVSDDEWVRPLHTFRSCPGHAQCEASPMQGGGERCVSAVHTSLAYVCGAHSRVGCFAHRCKSSDEPAATTAELWT